MGGGGGVGVEGGWGEGGRRGVVVLQSHHCDCGKKMHPTV